MADEHPARRAGRLSQRHVANGDRDAWLALFADDAVIQDPVGPSPLDPSGQGHRGKAAIAAFWDGVISKGRVSFDYPRSFAAGDECAFSGTVINTFASGQEFRADGVFVYRVNAAGQLVSLRAFWEFANPQGARHEPVTRD
jgi:ketosteroid isomerase-like protein